MSYTHCCAILLLLYFHYTRLHWDSEKCFSRWKGSDDILYFVPAIVNGPQSNLPSSSWYFYFNTYLFLTMIHFYTHYRNVLMVVFFFFVHRERRMQVSTFSTTTWSMDRSPPKSWLSSCVRGEVLFWEESSWWWGGGVRRCNWYWQECDVKFVFYSSLLVFLTNQQQLCFKVKLKLECLCYDNVSKTLCCIILFLVTVMLGSLLSYNVI